MSPFNPANPSLQVVVENVEPQTYPGNGDSGEIDVTGYRQLLVGVNVPGGAYPIPPAGSTIEVDALGPDGQWYQLQPPVAINAVGRQLIRPWGVFSATIRVLWTMPGPGGLGYWVIGES